MFINEHKQNKHNFFTNIIKVSKPVYYWKQLTVLQRKIHYITFDFKIESYLLRVEM